MSLGNPNMAMHTPLGVLGAAFVLMCEKDGSFTGALSRRCPTLAPLLVYRIGAVVNFLAERGITDQRAVASDVTGIYPNNTPSAGASPDTAVISVRNALQALAIPGNLTAAMNCVVGIQDSIIMLGVDKILGAADTTLQGASGAYKMTRTAQGYANSAGAAKEKLKQLRDFIQAQRGNSPDIFIAMM